MNTNIKRSHVKTFIIRSPFYPVILTDVLPVDAELDFVELTGARIQMENGKEYRLKDGYNLRILPGGTGGSTVISEDFICEGKRAPGKFSVALSIVVDVSSREFNVSMKTDAEGVLPVAVEATVSFRTANMVLDGTVIHEVPNIRLKPSAIAIRVIGITEHETLTDHYMLELDRGREVSVHSDSIKNWSEDEGGHILILSAGEAPVVISQTLFDVLFISSLNVVKIEDRISQSIDSMPES